MTTYLRFLDLPDVSLHVVLLTTAASAVFTHAVTNQFTFLAIPYIVVFFVGIPTALSIIFTEHLSLLAAVPSAFVLYYATFIVSVVLYQLSPIHPLARYPGPIGLKISSLNVLKMILVGDRFKYTHGLHEKYGSDIVRIGPNELSIRDADAILAIMGTNGLSKGVGYDGRCLFNEKRNLLTLRDSVVHAKRRRPWNRGMSTGALKEYEPILAARVTQLLEMITREKDKVVDLTECFKYFAYDFMGDMAFGGGSELMRDGDVHGAVATSHTFARRGAVLESLPWFAYHIAKLPVLSEKFRKIREQANQRARERIQRGTSSKDLFHYLNNEDGSDQVTPPIDAVAAEGILVVIAGSDTVSSVLSTILYLLMRHTEVYQKLQEEVDKYYPQGENALDCKFHPDMRYLDAVINESMRVYPVLPSGSQRGTREHGILAGPYYVPPNTSVRVHTWGIHRDPRNFSPHPEAFWPERWLIAEDPTSYNAQAKSPLVHNMNAYIPFSFGPANCVGKNLALKELKMSLCLLLQQVKFRFADGYDPSRYEEEMEDYFAYHVSNLPAMVTTRH